MATGSTLIMPSMKLNDKQSLCTLTDHVTAVYCCAASHMHSTAMNHVIDSSPISKACDHHQGQGTGQKSRALPVPNPHHAERQLASSMTAPAVMTHLLTHASGRGLSLTLEAQMLASGPNMTCPEAHPINCQQSGKRSQLPAVHIMHLFTHSRCSRFHFHLPRGKKLLGEVSGGGGGGCKGARSYLLKAKSTVCQAVYYMRGGSLLHARQLTCAYTLFSMVTKAFSSL